MPTLIVQMGHAGRPRPGTDWSVGTAGERDWTTTAGPVVARMLDGRADWTVRLIDADPGFDPLHPVFGGQLAAYRGDAFVALHCDGSESTASRGASVGYQSPAGQQFAAGIKTGYDTGGWPGGWKPDNFTTNEAKYYGVTNARAVGNDRAVIFEVGTMTNPADRAELTGPGGTERVARAIAAALGIPLDVPQEDEDTMVAYSHKLPKTAADEFVEEVVPLPWQGGITGVQRVFAMLTNTNKPLQVRVAHWQVFTNGVRTVVPAVKTDGKQLSGTTIDPLAAVSTEAPDNAASLIIDYSSPLGASVLIEAK